ncbi:hypothetical protein CRYUN_Cryun25bG0039700 [Craigia yunnanensis]
MGCCLSCSCTSPNTFNTIRLVHLNAQLVSAGSKPLNPETRLQPGHLYFLLPLSALKDNISPLDMASVVKRLTARAKSIRSDDVSPKTSTSWSQNGYSSIGNSAVRSPGRPERMEMTFGHQKSSRARARSWKPILNTIREISFTRSESDPREVHFITTK